MTLRFDYYGNVYDDAVPSFIVLPGGIRFFHRPSSKFGAVSKLRTRMKKSGYVPHPKEMSAPPQWWADRNAWLGRWDYEPPSPEPYPDVSWSREDILAYLAQRKVILPEDWVDRLSVVELLAFIDDAHDTP